MLQDQLAAAAAQQQAQQRLQQARAVLVSTVRALGPLHPCSHSWALTSAIAAPRMPHIPLPPKSLPLPLAPPPP